MSFDRLFHPLINEWSAGRSIQRESREEIFDCMTFFRPSFADRARVLEPGSTESFFLFFFSIRFDGFRNEFQCIDRPPRSIQFLGASLKKKRSSFDIPSRAFHNKRATLKEKPVQFSASANQRGDRDVNNSPPKTAAPKWARTLIGTSGRDSSENYSRKYGTRVEGQTRRPKINGQATGNFTKPGVGGGRVGKPRRKVVDVPFFRGQQSVVAFWPLSIF